MLMGLLYWKSTTVEDHRGMFTKIISEQNSEQIGDFPVKDFFSTKSHKSVVRGMHLQVGKFASNRIIFVKEGTIEDVVIDLRIKTNESMKFEKSVKILGPKEEFDCVYVPANIAHGYATLQNATILYLSNKRHSIESDQGFNPLSFSHNWQIKNPILSDRDNKLPFFRDFVL